MSILDALKNLVAKRGGIPKGSNIAEVIDDLAKTSSSGGGSGLPNVTHHDNEKILFVENGEWIVATADDGLNENSHRPIANSAVSTGLSTLRAEMYDIQPIIRACDATAQAALEQMSGGSVSLVVPIDIDNAEGLVAYAANCYLLWTNGTKLDSGKLLTEIDMTNNAITMYARGKSSMVSGVMGVDTSWTVTSL